MPDLTPSSPDDTALPPEPDDRNLFRILRKAGVEADDAYTFVQTVMNIASSNLITRFETNFTSKLDALNTKLEALNSVSAAQRDALNTKFNILLVVLGILTAAGILSFFTG